VQEKPIITKEFAKPIIEKEVLAEKHVVGTLGMENLNLGTNM